MIMSNLYLGQCATWGRLPNRFLSDDQHPPAAARRTQQATTACSEFPVDRYSETHYH